MYFESRTKRLCFDLLYSIWINLLYLLRIQGSNRSRQMLQTLLLQAGSDQLYNVRCLDQFQWLNCLLVSATATSRALLHIVLIITVVLSCSLASLVFLCGLRLGLTPLRTASCFARRRFLSSLVALVHLTIVLKLLGRNVSLLGQSLLHDVLLVDTAVDGHLCLRLSQCLTGLNQLREIRLRKY